MTALLLAGLGQAALAGPQDFTLFNRTNVDIHAVFVAPSESEDWEEDLMDGSVLLNGADIEINFAPDEDVELWDICVQDQEGNSLYWREIDLMNAYEIILEPDGVARIKNVE
jgi:hypothetical protein